MSVKSGFGYFLIGLFWVVLVGLGLLDILLVREGYMLGGALASWNRWQIGAVDKLAAIFLFTPALLILFFYTGYYLKEGLKRGALFRRVALFAGIELGVMFATGSLRELLKQSAGVPLSAAGLSTQAALLVGSLVLLWLSRRFPEIGRGRLKRNAAQ